jgi:hypothetical protein
VEVSEPHEFPRFLSVRCARPRGTLCDERAAAGNPQYLWNTTAITQSIYVKFGGAYSVTVTNINNCSVVSNPVTITVNSLPAPPVITKVGNVLTSTTAIAYQWYLNGTLSPGAISQALTITQDGNYQVEITDANGCKNRSTVMNVTGVGFNDIANAYDVKLFPNPNTGIFTLQFTDAVTREIQITDVTGRIVFANTEVTGTKQFNLPETASGIYFLQIMQQGQVRNLKFTIVK